MKLHKVCAVLCLLAAPAAPSLSADSSTEPHGVYAQSMNDGADGSERCSISLVDGFRRLALFKVTLSIENEKTAYVEAWGRIIISDKERTNPSAGSYFPVSNVSVGALFNLPTGPEDGTITPVPESQGVRYRTTMGSALNAMRQLRAGLPVTVAIEFDGNKKAQSDVSIGMMAPAEAMFFQDCVERIDMASEVGTSVAKPARAEGR